MSKKSVIYDSVSVSLRDKGEPLTPEDAKALLGWTTEADAGEGGVKVAFGSDYSFRDKEGKKVRLLCNVTNRPFRISLAMRYANEILRRKWKLNGETIIIDRHGMIQSGQHRLVGLVLAEQLRQKDVPYWGGYGWRGPVTIEALLVMGIDDKPETVDTLDIGQKRSLGDVLFRNHVWVGCSESESKRLSSILAGAARLCWLRAGGRDVSDAPHFPHSEALDFIADHPRLLDAVLYVFNCDGGGGADGKKLSTYVSLGYAAALLYLAGMGATDPDKYHAEGSSALDDSLWEKSEQFWDLFADGEQSLHPLRNALARSDASGATARDEIVGTIVKAYNLYADGEEVTGRAIKIKKATDPETGKTVLNERPRLGGIDAEIEVYDDEPADDDGELDETSESKPKRSRSKKTDAKTNGKAGDTADKPKRSRKKKGKEAERDTANSAGGFAVGDSVNVKDEAGDWTGKVTDFTFSDGESMAKVAADEGGEYVVEVSKLEALAVLEAAE